MTYAARAAFPIALILLALAESAPAVDRGSGAPLAGSNAETSKPTQRPAAPADIKTIRRLCAADLRTYCAEVRPGGGRLMQCARTHEAALSADCRAALETVEKYRKARAH